MRFVTQSKPIQLSILGGDGQFQAVEVLGVQMMVSGNQMDWHRKVAEFFLNLCAELASKRVPVMQQIAQHHDSVGIVFFGE